MTEFLHNLDELDVTETSSDTAAKVSRLNKGTAFIFEVIKLVLLAGVTIFLIRYYLFKPFFVKGQSMEPGTIEGEYLIIDELSYRLRAPERGEIIVFRAPVQEKDFYLKRVIGLPGERVKVENNKVVIYNVDYPQGLVLNEPYIVVDTPGTVNVELGHDQYFVMGDNRTASFDSRRFGPIPKSSIVGRMWLRGWPIQKVGTVDTPEY